MRKENFYTLRDMVDRLARQNAAELVTDLNRVPRVRFSYAMHTPDDEQGVSVGRAEDAYCAYFGANL